MRTPSTSVSIDGPTIGSSVSGIRMSAWIHFLLALALMTSATGAWFPHGPDTRGRRYCSVRQPVQCCPGRDDACAVPILDTVCYCDQFCRRNTIDCCPDFRDTCVLGRPWYSAAQHNPPEEKMINNCHHKGPVYEPGSTISSNCNNCTCTYVAAADEYNWQCTQKICLIRPELLDLVNAGSYGWKPAKYTFFWGLTLAEGVQYRLGTFEPVAPVKRMTSLRAHSNVALPTSFDARTQWPGLIHPIMDQGNCAASWAFSTTSVASDRLSIHSRGALRQTLSPQNLISCNNDSQQRGCEGGHLGRAWWYMRHTGVVSEACYPYQSGATSAAGRCQLRRPVRHARARVLCPSNWRTTSKVFQASPPYRISPNEREIMKEIATNGPVQATMEVKEDFYMYRSGVYRYSMPADYLAPNHRRTGVHSIKILGWGTDYSFGRRLKYWLCANSWGRKWGEDGYFRIQRGTNECRIESFVIGAWGRVHGQTISRPLRRRARNVRRRHARRARN